jgi:putative PIN family toxin of toxin-antitoxin system
MVLLRGIVVFSEATFAELETRLWKPKFDRYISLEARKAILRDGRATALRVEIPPELTKQHWSRDLGDDVFIRTALAAQASRLVSGNEDLLSVPVVEGLRICTPAQALLD